MPASFPSPPPRADTDHASRMRSLPRRTYRFRVLGMGLAGLPLAAVLREHDAGAAAWAWVVFSCYVWPHVAYRWAIRSADPLKAELRNFMIDSFCAGSWVPLMHFNLLPSVVLVTVVTADKINSGVRGLWLRSLPGVALAIALMGLLTGFAIDHETSTQVILACLPIMVIHTLAVSLSTYQLVRRVQRQNLQLAELSQRDALTGLDNRRHWETRAGALLAGDADATLLLLDTDGFKAVNDRHGHAVGDDVLRAIADVLRARLPAHAIAGRLGGDEFVVALALPLPAAHVVAEELRLAIEALEFARVPGLRVSTSIGMAQSPGRGLDLREWLEAADHALYRAKQAGRNRTSTRERQP